MKRYLIFIPFCNEMFLLILTFADCFISFPTAKHMVSCSNITPIRTRHVLSVKWYVLSLCDWFDVLFVEFVRYLRRKRITFKKVILLYLLSSQIVKLLFSRIMYSIMVKEIFGRHGKGFLRMSIIFNANDHKAA